MHPFIQKHFATSKYRVNKAAKRYRATSDSELACMVEIETNVKRGLKIFFFVFGFILAFMGAMNINLVMLTVAGLSEFAFIGLMLWRESLASIEYKRRLIRSELVKPNNTLTIKGR